MAESSVHGRIFHSNRFMIRLAHARIPLKFDSDVLTRFSQVTQTTRAIQTRIGQKPVVLKKEVEGFALNRIQYAIINECWNLIEDGVLSAPDMDTVMSEGLGMRYAFLGPLETAHLNAEGKFS